MGCGLVSEGGEPTWVWSGDGGKELVVRNLKKIEKIILKTKRTFWDIQDKFIASSI